MLEFVLFMLFMLMEIRRAGCVGWAGVQEHEN